MSGSPPALSRVPDVGSLTEFFAEHAPPHRVAFSQGDESVEHEFVRCRDGFGNGRAELVYEDGRHVTVDVESGVERVEVAE